MASLSATLSVIVLAILTSEVTAFAKLMVRTLDEKVGITLNEISKSLADNETKAVSNEVSETQAVPINYELAIVSQLLERVPLIDGYVWLLNSLQQFALLFCTAE